MRRDCVFLVADGNMAAAIQGFLDREQFHQSLGIAPFEFSRDLDLLVEPGHDPGVYLRAHELLRPYERSHQHAVILLDAAWDGSPGAERISGDICGHMPGCGWATERFAVVVIDPELENWIWQDSPHVAAAVRHSETASLRDYLRGEGLWPEGASKPVRPKETLEAVLRRARRPRSSAVYREITQKVTTRGCQDAAFRRLVEALQQWFPPESQQ